MSSVLGRVRFRFPSSVLVASLICAAHSPKSTCDGYRSPWFDRRAITAGARLMARIFASPDLDEAVATVRNIYTALSKEISPKHNHAALLNLLIMSTMHEKEVSRYGEVPRHSTASERESVLTDGVPDEREKKALILPPLAKESSQTNIPSNKLIKTATKFCKFSSAAYGVVFLKGMKIFDEDAGWPSIEMSTAEADRWCILQHTGISDSDLVSVRLDPQRDLLHMPGYYIGVDHESKSIVLSIRGTISIKDSVTDLVCDASPFLNGFAHRGMAQGAELVLQECKEDILNLIKDHSDYGLVVTGHSLGGGISMLLAMLLLNNRKDLKLEHTDIKCYAYAPPPVFGPLCKMSNEVLQNIHGFVFRHDIVSRLCLASCVQLLSTVTELAELQVGARDRLAYIIEEMKPPFQEWDDQLTSEKGIKSAALSFGVRYSQKLHHTISGRLSSIGKGSHLISEHVNEWVNNPQIRDRLLNAVERNREDVTRLYIPGTVYWMTKNSTGKTDDPIPDDNQEVKETITSEVYSIREAHARDFERILLVDSCVVDHWPSAYELSLRSLSSNIK